MSAKCNLKIIDFNYAFQDNVETTATSENVNFPVSNLKNEFRGRLWKSGGHFEITSVNNRIDFKDTGVGSEVNAVLTKKTYTPTELETEIKTKMELVGDKTYTASYSILTGDWTISTSGSFLSLLWGTGTSGSPLGPEIGFFGGDRLGATTYTGAVAIHSFETVTWDLKTSEEIDSFLIFFDPKRGIRYSDDAVLRLQGNQTLDFSSPAVDQVLTIDNEFRLASHFFTTGQNQRYWQVKNNDLSVELGVVFFGKGIELSRNAANGFNWKLRDNSIVRKNIFGNSYSDLRTKVQRLEINFKVFPEADLRTLRTIYNRVGKTEPIVVAFDSQEVVFDKNLFLIYGKFTTQLNISHVTAQFFNTPLNIEETF